MPRELTEDDLAIAEVLWTDLARSLRPGGALASAVREVQIVKYFKDTVYSIKALRKPDGWYVTDLGPVEIVISDNAAVSNSMRFLQHWPLPDPPVVLQF